MTSKDRLYELRDAMIQTVDAYCDGRLSLGKLVNSLEAYIEMVDGLAPANWVEHLRSDWWELEYVFATMLDAGRSLPDEREQLAITSAVATFRTTAASRPG